MLNGAQFFTIQLIDANGAPYSQCKLYHYATGGTTLKDIWSDEGKTTPLAQPFVADTAGRLSFYGDGDYHFVIKDSAGIVTILDRDPIRITKLLPLKNSESYGTSAPGTPTSANLNHLFLKIDADGEIVDLLACGDTDDPEYVSVVQAVINNYGINNLITKYPIADIRHKDFAGGAVAGSASDQSSQIQAAIDYLDSEGGGILFIPPGIFKAKNLDVPENIKICGTGHSSVLKLYDAASPYTYLLKSADQGNFDMFDLWLDGNGLGNDNYLLWIYNNTGVHSHIRILSCHFENQISPSNAIRVEGTVANQFPGIFAINGGCHFHNTHIGLFVQYVDGCNVAGNLFRGLTGTPIYISDSTECLINNNNFGDWGSTAPAVDIINSDENVISVNVLKGTEDYSIRTSGTSNYNLIEGNNVRGGHTNDIVSAGTNDIVVHNIGSAVVKGGQGETLGGESTTDWDFIKYEGTTDTDPFSLAGQMYDSDIIFTDTALAVDDPPSGYDHIRLYNLTGEENMFFAVRDIVTTNNDHTLKLGNSDVFDTIVSIPDGEPYRGYPNLTDTPPATWGWEATPFLSVTLEPTNYTPNVTSDHTIYGEQGLIKIEVWRNDGGGNGYVKFECTGISQKNVTGTVSTSGTTIISTSFIYKPSGLHTLTLYGTWTSAGVSTAKFLVKVYRLKRSVDL